MIEVRDRRLLQPSKIPPLDYLTTVVFFVLLPFLAHSRAIRLNYEWTDFFLPYFISVAIYSIFVATIFHLIDRGLGASLQYVRSIANGKNRLILFLIGFVEAVWLLGPGKSITLFVDIMATVILIKHLRKHDLRWGRSLASLMLPAIYFAAGFILISSYNVLIGSIRYYASYDSFFNELDRLLLGGWSVPALSEKVAVHASPVVFLLLEKIYFFMFPQIGAAIIVLTYRSGSKVALRFVGTIAIAYQLATLIYFCIPSIGPFCLSTPISASLPRDLVTVRIQQDLVNKLNALWHQGFKPSIGLDFYIAFPCMHLAQPIIVLWFLRKLKRVFWALLVYDFVMLWAILFLQWHYVVDLFGGGFVALVAIFVHQIYLKRQQRSEQFDGGED
jgi:hypothetical protein